MNFMLLILIILRQIKNYFDIKSQYVSILRMGLGDKIYLIQFFQQIISKDSTWDATFMNIFLFYQFFIIFFKPTLSPRI